MDSSSDSESNELYTRAVGNGILKRTQITAQLEDYVDLTLLYNEEDNAFEKLNSRSFMDMAQSSSKEELVVISDTDSQEVLETPAAVRPRIKLRSDSRPQNDLAKKRCVNIEIIDLEIDGLPMRMNVSSNSRPQRNSKRARKTIASPAEKQARLSRIPARKTDIPLEENVAHGPKVISQSVIVLDDDSDFANMPPIVFMSRSASRKLREQLNKDIDNISPSDVMVDDEDKPVIITIEWRGTKTLSRKQFDLRTYQKFETIFKEFAKIEDLPINRILIFHNFNIVTPKDTPDSLDLKFEAAMSGSISPYDMDYDDLVETKVKNDGSIKVKLALESKKTLQFTIMKHQKMSVLYKKCCEELNCKESVIQLTFDGDYVEPQDLLSSLDVLDGDLFNVFIKKE